jgi:hypothetical protein
MASVQTKFGDPKTGQSGNGLQQNYNHLLEANQRVLTRWFRGMAEISQEVVQFTQSRLQEEMAVWSSLAGCKKPEEVFQCQRQFAEKTASQYAEEIGKLSQMVMQLAVVDPEPPHRPHA